MYAFGPAMIANPTIFFSFLNKCIVSSNIVYIVSWSKINFSHFLIIHLQLQVILHHENLLVYDSYIAPCWVVDQPKQLLSTTFKEISIDLDVAGKDDPNKRVEQVVLVIVKWMARWRLQFIKTLLKL